MKKLKHSLDLILVAIVLYITLFQNALENISKIFGYVDEMIAVALIFLGLVKLIINKKNKLDKENIKILICMVVIAILGFVSNFVYGYQNINYAIKDAIVVFKGIASYIMIQIVVKKFDMQRYSDYFNIQFKVITVAMFTLTIANVFLKIFPFYEIRFGFPTQQLIFSHPTYLASFGVVIIALLSAFMKSHKENWKYILMMCLVICSTGRTKIIIFLVGYMYIYYVNMIRKRKLDRKDLISITVLGVVFAIGQIVSYLKNIYWARSAITVGSVLVARDHFPIGSGFGTYASWISGQHYSPLYYRYGMEVVPGLRPDFYEFIADTFWPMILGQFGFIGLMAFLYIIYNMYRKICKSNNLYNYFAQLTLFLYMLVASLAEASFSGPSAVLILSLIALLGNCDLENSKI